MSKERKLLGSLQLKSSFQVTSKPTSTLLKTRLSNLVSFSTSEEVVLNILSVIGISCHGILLWPLQSAIVSLVRNTASCHLSTVLGEVLWLKEPSIFYTKIVINVIMNLNSFKDCFVLHQGCHSLSNIAQASIKQLMDCSLDEKTAKKVYNFFHD